MTALCASLAFASPVAARSDSGPSWIEVLLTNPLLYVSSPLEAQIGQSFYQQAMGERVYGTGVPSPRAQAVFERLIPVAKRRRADLTYRLTVLQNDDMINAFATPGGFVYITTGLLSKVTDDELAGVLGHELVHSVRSHTMQQWSLVTSLSQLRRMEAGEEVLPGVLADVAAALGSLGYSRAQESEADVLGQAWASEAGYDPEGLTRALRKIQSDARTPAFFELLADHPLTDHRVARLQENAAALRSTGRPLVDESPQGASTRTWAIVALLVALLYSLLAR